jgi:hypothetical protein
MNMQEKKGKDSCPTHITGEVNSERSDLITGGITFTVLHFDYLHMPSFYFNMKLLKENLVTKVLPLFYQ